MWTLLFLGAVCVAFALGFILASALSLGREDQLKFPHP